jgi:predicted dehydrogenase
MPPNKRIGFFDYRLDNFHAEVYLKAIRGPLAHRGYDVVGATALVEAPSRDWAAERGATYCDSLEELAGDVDCLMILAPSNPEVHLEMCRRALPLRKPTFVDKTFAPNSTIAEEIFALADRAGTPIQSTSALRSTAVQRHVAELDGSPRSMIVFASGSSLAEYGVHPVELVVSCMGPDVEQVMCLGPEDYPQFILLYSGDRSATIGLNLVADVPFSATVVSNNANEHIPIDGSRLFVDAAAGILDFFDAGRPLVDRRETLAIRRILDVVLADCPRHRFLSLNEPVSSVAVR